MTSNGPPRGPPDRPPTEQSGKAKKARNFQRPPHMSGQQSLHIAPRPAPILSPVLSSPAIQGYCEAHPQPAMYSPMPIRALAQQSTQGEQPGMYPPTQPFRPPVPQSIPNHLLAVQQQAPVYGYPYGAQQIGGQGHMPPPVQLPPPGPVFTETRTWQHSTTTEYGILHPFTHYGQGSQGTLPYFLVNHPPVQQDIWPTQPGPGSNDEQVYNQPNTQTPVADTRDHIAAPRPDRPAPVYAFLQRLVAGQHTALSHAPRYEIGSHGQQREQQPRPSRARKRRQSQQQGPILRVDRRSLADRLVGHAESLAAGGRAIVAHAAGVEKKKKRKKTRGKDKKTKAESGVEDEDEEQEVEEAAQGSSCARHRGHDKDHEGKDPDQGQGPSQGPNHGGQSDGYCDGELDRGNNAPADHQEPSSGQNNQQAPGDNEVLQQDLSSLPPPPPPRLSALRSTLSTPPCIIPAPQFAATTTASTDLARSYSSVQFQPLMWNPFRTADPQSRPRHPRHDMTHAFKVGRQGPAQRKWQLGKARFVSEIEGAMERRRFVRRS